MKYLNQRLR